MAKKTEKHHRLSRRIFLQSSLSAGAGLFIRPARQTILDQNYQSGSAATSERSLYLDPTKPAKDRVDDLVSQMTLDEKIAQMGSHAPAIDRLGVPAYNWWNEALHGIGRAGIATVFPQAIGLASTWNVDLIHRMASAISDEGRAKHHEALRKGIHDIYTGLTFWSPNINIFRDPRWGRGQETYGEDPYLTGQIGLRFVRGLQGDDPNYLKLVATPKHFAAHSGPEAVRHSFNAVVSPTDLQMTYLPAFKTCITEGKAFSIMGAYNRLNGEACCASPTLLGKILREEWGFEGYVVADCGALSDIYQNHFVVKTAAEAAALAVLNGCDLDCCGEFRIPCTYPDLKDAVEQGLLTEADIERSVKRLFTARFRLGMFDPPETVPYAQIPYSVVDSPEHRALALEVAQQSLVLLKNQDQLLPLDKSKLRSIAVIGPNADNTLVLTGNYMGTPSEPVSVLAGIKALVEPDTEVRYARGCAILDGAKNGFAEAVDAATNAQIAIMVMGLSQQVEGEEGQMEGNPPGISSLGDRKLTLNIPPVQQALLEAVYATGTPIVLVLINGSMVAINWADEHISAILEAWYPGQAGGTAVANALFGAYNPGGRLPVTFYRSTKDLPKFENYQMENRTYRYFSGDPLYAFGYGLSYTTFAYHGLAITPNKIASGDSVEVQVEVENTGRLAGDEVVQLYLQDVEASSPIPRLQLKGFTRIHLAPGEKQAVQFTITPEHMSFADAEGKWQLEAGSFVVWVGGRQPVLSSDSQPANVLRGEFVLA
ncbi:MAG: glycoside hydrolase family 3 C-terminal domain-containing protein [Anaerolineae bacterium]|nr:glycoside hydrolase family 3 C-terminal domain-containing protein [Anaerolineae bacterium]